MSSTNFAARESQTPNLASAFARHARPEQARLLHALNLDVVYHAAHRDTLVFDARPGDAGERGRTEVLDLVGGHGSGLFGHNHPRLIEVAERCLRQRSPFSAQASVRAVAGRLAARLSARVGESTGAQYVVTLGSSGADAVEAAVKHATVARARRLGALHDSVERELRRARRDGVDRVGIDTGGSIRSLADLLTESAAVLTAMSEQQPAFVSLAGAFHGNTAAAGALTDRTSISTDLAAPGPRRIRLDTWDPEAIVTAFDAERVPFCRIIFDALGVPHATWEHVSTIAACFAEPIQGEGGVHEVPAEALRALRDLADRHHAALVFDEIQCGMGRTGTFLASEPAGVIADYYLLSKSLGGSLAKISAMLVDSSAYISDFGRYHTSTFSDDDFSATIAEASLDLLESAQPRVIEAGALLIDRLEQIATRWPGVIAGVRGRGLLIGIELRPPRGLPRVLAEFVRPEFFGYIVAGYLLHVHSIRVMPTLSAPMTLRVQPSAYIETAEIERAGAALDTMAGLIQRGEFASLLEHLTQAPTTAWVPPQAIARPRQLTGHSTPAWGKPPRVAFLANLREAADLREHAPALASWTDAQCAALFDRTRGILEPFEITRQFVDSLDGSRVEVCVIGVPITALQAVECQRAGHGAWLRNLVLDAVEYAIKIGASVVGLGGYTSIVTGAARDVIEDSVRVTSGNSLTAACAYEQLRSHLSALPPADRTLGVVGATGNIGAVMAELLAPHSAAMTLVGRAGTRSRLERVAAGLAGTVRVSEDPAALRECAVIVTATNSAIPLITAADLAPDRPVVICDLAVPGDVDPRVGDLPGVTLISGGRMLLPDGQTPDFPGTALPPGTVYACMAESILLGFEPSTPSPSFGALTVAGVQAAHALAARHGLQACIPVLQDSHDC
jgi:acetylornithine/succinyldiaminopimelate/putrescine aminotransferase/predicted amino acid dehydrogenase